MNPGEIAGASEIQSFTGFGLGLARKTRDDIGGDEWIAPDAAQRLYGGGDLGAAVSSAHAGEDLVGARLHGKMDMGADPRIGEGVEKGSIDPVQLVGGKAERYALGSRQEEIQEARENRRLRRDTAKGSRP